MTILNLAQKMILVYKYNRPISSTHANEDVWMDLLYYRERNHRDKFVAKISNNKECQTWYKMFTKLRTPRSEIINGEFSRMS